MALSDARSPLTFGMVLFPNLTQLDLTGPYEVFARLPRTKVYLVAAALTPVRSERGLTICPDATFESVPALDMLPSGTNESVRGMWISMIVGMHFLPMAISFGPRVLVLGAICIALDCRSESPWLAWSGLSPHGRVGEVGDWLMVVA